MILSPKCWSQKSPNFVHEVPNLTLITRCQGKVPNSKSWIASTANTTSPWNPARQTAQRPLPDVKTHPAGDTKAASNNSSIRGP